MARRRTQRAAAVGVAEHGNSAVLVTVAPGGELLDRRRIDLTDRGLPTHPHHHEGSWAMGRYLDNPWAGRFRSRKPWPSSSECASQPRAARGRGSRTYELALKLGWVYGDTPTTVLSHRALHDDRKSVEFYSGDVSRLVNDRLKPRYKNIWLVGGAMVAKEFIRLNLADDIRIVIMPIILGDGTLFVDHVGHEHPLHLQEVTAYKNGLVELWYEIRKV